MRFRYRLGPGHAAALAAFAALSLPFFAAGAAGQVPGNVYRLGAAPGWVEVESPDYSAIPPAGDRQVSTYHVLLDHQIDVQARGYAQFRRSVVRLVNDAGAESYSQITLYADPGFETLTLHWIRVLRDGALADRLAAARITVLPEESDLQRRIYSGLDSINVLVPDLRAGDVLDYAYTLDAVNPSFPGHFSAQVPISWSVPVHRERLRLRHPVEHPVQYRVHGGLADPDVSERGGYRELEFDLRDLPAKAGEADVPGWYPLWAEVEFSDMPDWRTMAARTADIFHAQSSIGPRTRAAIDQLKALPGGDADRTLSALRMIQDKIRYASISIGHGSYRPFPSDVVLERNFGDCKDKSLLLANLLQGIGVDARVALVNTETGHSLPGALPSSRAFDHAIVRARIGRQILWLDPTRSWQGGTLATTAQADYEYALVVDRDTKALEPMPRARPDASSHDVRIAFDLSAGVSKPASIEIETRYGGLAADTMRADVADRNAEVRSADYLNYYAKYYPGIQATAPVAVVDDRDANVVTTRERYRLDRGFRERGAGELVFEVFPDEMFRYAGATETPKRTAPLAQAHPVRVTQRFEIRLPEGWPIRNSTVHVQNPAFLYESAKRYAKNVLNLDFRFESRTDVVPIEQVPKYLADQKRMDDDLGYELTYREGGGAGASGIAPYPMAAILLGLLAGVWVAMRGVLRYDPAPREPVRPVVVLNVLAMCGAMGFLVYALASYARVDVWSALPVMAGDALAPWVQHAVAVLLFLSFLIAPGIFATAWMFLRKRSSAPNLVIVMFWGGAAIGLFADRLMTHLAPEESEAGPTAVAVYVRDLLSLVIWTLYLKRSERVAATFRRRRNPATAEMAAPLPGTHQPASRETPG